MKTVKLCLVLFFMCVFSLEAHAIKVGLITNTKSVQFASSVPAEIYDGYKDQVLYEITPMKVYQIKTKGSDLSILINKKNVSLGSDRIYVRTKEPGFLCSKRAWYRGDFIFQNRENGITLINDIELEEYLKGVVPAEMPSKWNYEALKAQAIAARSYAIATKNARKHGSKGFDLVDDTADQAYGGASAEKDSTSRAVDETRGIVLVQDKKVLPTYYHACAGGRTKVWDSGSSFLHSVPSFDNGVKKNGHGVGMSQYGANNLAAQGLNAYQILNYFYKNFKFARLSDNWDL